ncbi:hypothetical protein [uncultured Paludibaculum sp.]|uniref:hypothetical protein n=1 Tax=uncultured Paludibaculum sp. TaxID=1765020 RepID=UPI002AAB5EA3|nr:hypothetical protein [uncultured Paludibaculum sp.]
MSKSSVKIINPVPGKANYASASRARRFVASGIAEFVAPDKIRFTCEDRQKLNAAICAATTDWLSDRFPEVKAHNWRGPKPQWQGLYRPGIVKS